MTRLVTGIYIFLREVSLEAAEKVAESRSRLPSGTSESACFPLAEVPSGRRDPLFQQSPLACFRTEQRLKNEFNVFQAGLRFGHQGIFGLLVIRYVGARKSQERTGVIPGNRDDGMFRD